ncbi:DUF4277 domain-containing protein [Anoxybacillus flavithermus]
MRKEEQFLWSHHLEFHVLDLSQFMVKWKKYRREVKQSPEWPWLTMLSAVDGRTKKMDEEMFRELEGIAMTEQDILEALEEWQNLSVDPENRYAIVKLIVLDILSGRQALVHLEQWAHDIDLPKLIRPGLEPSWFNDDAIARHLDRLYKANIHQVLSSCLVQIYKKEGLSLRVFHADTTDKTVYGALSGCLPWIS